MAPTSWKVENSGSTPARLAMATATTAYDGISASAKANGSTLLDYSAGFASYDPTLIVPAKGSLDVSWSVSRLDPAAHADLFEQAAQHPVTLLSASFLFCAQSTEPDASDSVPFAVYSEDDASLTFYKRRNHLRVDVLRLLLACYPRRIDVQHLCRHRSLPSVPWMQVFDRARPVEGVDGQGADIPWDVLGLLGT